jgi:hypothetical protein
MGFGLKDEVVTARLKPGAVVFAVTLATELAQLDNEDLKLVEHSGLPFAVAS